MTLKAAISDIIKILVIANVQKQPPEEVLLLWKKGFLEISQNSQENVCVLVCIEKETLALVFSCQFCKISKNTFFTEHSWTTASEHNLISDLKLGRYGTIPCKNQSKTRPNELVSSTD